MSPKPDWLATKEKIPWCTCGTKTPQGQFHKHGCPAREKGWS